VLPWSNRRNDALRLRLIMLAALCVSTLLGFMIPRWQLPEPERIATIEIPQRLATLIVKKAPPPPPPKQEQAPEEVAEQAESAETETLEEEKADTRKTAEKIGLLAFSQDFADIMDASSDIKMGSQAAIIRKAPAASSKPAARSLITSQVDFSASGTGSTGVRRTDAIGDSNTLKQVEFTRIDTATVAAIDSQQTGTGRAAGRRSDEEIQVVFDRYKDALYRIYNRELRKNSFLKGKLVLQLTIEADGKVSKCTIKSSDLDSAELEKKILARVLRFNFGDKQGASPLTILYPIEFFPAS
jgi:outer membrane biosynthesis protein TonB